jgi:hypothetical protein
MKEYHFFAPVNSFCSPSQERQRKKCWYLVAKFDDTSKSSPRRTDVAPKRRYVASREGGSRGPESLKILDSGFRRNDRNKQRIYAIKY